MYKALFILIFFVCNPEIISAQLYASMSQDDSINNYIKINITKPGEDYFIVDYFIGLESSAMPETNRMQRKNCFELVFPPKCRLPKSLDSIFKDNLLFGSQGFLYIIEKQKLKSCYDILWDMTGKSYVEVIKDDIVLRDSLIFNELNTLKNRNMPIFLFGLNYMEEYYLVVKPYIYYLDKNFRKMTLLHTLNSK
jgi:hypothetical protein